MKKKLFAVLAAVLMIAAFVLTPRIGIADLGDFSGGGDYGGGGWDDDDDDYDGGYGRRGGYGGRSGYGGGYGGGGRRGGGSSYKTYWRH